MYTVYMEYVDIRHISHFGAVSTRVFEPRNFKQSTVCELY